MNKAVFLDRDGVINRENGAYVSSPETFALLPHALRHIPAINKMGYLVVVITNQGGIAKGLYTHEILSQLHHQMYREVEASGGRIDALYYCPHHPLTGKCLCRKPESILIEKALAKYKINPLKSVFIGDKPRDMEAAEAAGVRGVLIHENEDWGFVLESLAR